MSNLRLLNSQIDQFVEFNQLQPADAIMVKKSPFKLLDHYIVYLGFQQGRHLFMANGTAGVKIYNYNELMSYLKTFVPVRIDKFIGTHQERMEAVSRALNRQDESSYNLILNNCEHFKNWVQKGIHESEQFETYSKILFGVGAAITVSSLASKKKGGVYAGGIIMLLCILAWIMSENQKNKLSGYSRF